MSNDPYSARVRALFDAPAHAGCNDGAARASREEQGVRIALSAEIDEDAVKSLRFEAWGCPHVIAAAEALCERYEGLPASDLLEFSANDLMQSLAVPVEKTGRILVIEDAVRSLGQILCGTSNPDD